LVAAMNPCPCGYFTDNEKPCTCTPMQLLNYRRKLSGPLLDRLDLCIEVPKVKTSALLSEEKAESSTEVRARIEQARAKQRQRLRDQDKITNAELNHRTAASFINLTEDCKPVLEQALHRFKLSARSYFRMLKVSRTIADLEGSEAVEAKHLLEALQYRFQSALDEEKERLDMPVTKRQTETSEG